MRKKLVGFWTFLLNTQYQFFDAYTFCSTAEISTYKYGGCECCGSCDTGTWNQFYWTNHNSMDYEEDEVVRVLFVSE